MKKQRIPGKYWLLFIIILSLSFITWYCSDRSRKLNTSNNGDSDSEIAIFPDPINPEAVSTGENILIHQIPWLNANEGVKQKCIQNWQLKVDSEFDRYLLECPIDIEAKIYSNNKKVREIAATLTNSTIVNIAIVVPISGKKNELRNKLNLSFEEEPNLNGTRVFDSIEILRGIELVQRENINGIQLGDKKVFLEVAIVDDSYADNISDEQKAQESANYLIDNRDTVAVIGHFSSDSIQAAASIYDNKLVAFSPTSTAIRTENNPTFSLGNSDKLKLNPYIFRTAPNDSVAIETLMNVIRNENENNNASLKTAMILYEEENTFSRLYKQHFEQEFKMTGDDAKIFDDASCKFYGNKAENQKKYCIDAIAKNQPDLLLLIPSSKRALELAGTVLKKINDLEPKPQLLGADSMFDPFFRSDFAEGMIVAVAVKSSNKTQLSWRGAMTYDAAKTIVKGIEDSKCSINSNDSNGNTNECLRQQIQQILSDDNFKADGILGKNTVLFENGDRKINESLEGELEEPQQVKKVEGTLEGYSFELYKLGN